MNLCQTCTTALPEDCEGWCDACYSEYLASVGASDYDFAEDMSAGIA